MSHKFNNKIFPDNQMSYRSCIYQDMQNIFHMYSAVKEPCLYFCKMF